MAQARQTQFGPDGEDVYATIMAVQSFHGVRIAVRIETHTADAYTGLEVCVDIIRRWKANVAGTPEHTQRERWPNNSHTTLEATIFMMLHRADSWCAKHVWTQSMYPVD